VKTVYIVTEFTVIRLISFVELLVEKFRNNDDLWTYPVPSSKNRQQKENWLFIPTSQLFWWEDLIVRNLLWGKNLSFAWIAVLWSRSILCDSGSSSSSDKKMMALESFQLERTKHSITFQVLILKKLFFSS